MNDTFDDFETQVQCEEYYPEETPLGEQLDGGNDEYCDWDATACAEGDYNTFEEQQVFLDNES